MVKRLYKDNKEITENFLWRSLQIASKQGILFIIFFISAYFLSTESFGIFNYLMAVIALLVIFSDFGVSTATSKYVAEYKSTYPARINSVIFTASIIILISASVISLILVLFGRALLKEYRYFILLVPYLYFLPLSSVMDGYYRGLKRFKELSIISISIGILVLAASYFIIKEHLLVGAIISQNLLFILLFSSLYLKTKRFRIKFDRAIFIKVFKYSIVVGFASFMYFLYSKADILVLKYFGYINEIGYYEIINRIFMLILAPFIILGQVIAPDITRHYSLQRFQLVKQKFVKHFWFFGAASLVIVPLLYFAFPVIIKTILSKYFTTETILMFKYLLVLLPLLIIAAVISHGHTVATGNAHLSLWTMIPAGLGNIILDILFITKYGFIGVIYATIICYVFATVSFIILYYSKLKRLIK